jgi:hypothetical protein
MPETMPTCNPSAFELACCVIVRSDTFYPKTFFTCQSVATLLVILVPLFVTNTASYGAASKVCYDRAFALRNETYFDVESLKYDPEWDMDDNSTWALFPAHLFNSIATVMSLFGFWVWLFFSPHNSEVARALDRTCKLRKKLLHTSTISRLTFTNSLVDCPYVGSYFPLRGLQIINCTSSIFNNFTPFTVAASRVFSFQLAVISPFSG